MDVSEPLQVVFWEFPAEEYAAWAALVGTPSVKTHGEYLTLVAALQFDQERQGIAVRRVRLTVAEMIAALAERGLPNTPDARAEILARRGAHGDNS